MNPATALDIEEHDRLLMYLTAARHIAAGESPRFSTLPGGVSSRTVLVERPAGEPWVIKQSLAKLRVDVEWYSDPERIHREAAGIRWLSELAPPGTIPPLIFEDHEHHLIAMAAVPQPHSNWKTVLLGGDVQADYVRQFGRLLGTIHRESAARRDEVASVFDDRSAFESLRIEPYYAFTAAQVPASAPFLSALIASVRTRRLTLVHGDFSPKNILVHAGRLVLLDHEVIHFGDPAFDLGFSLAHLLSKAHHLADRREVFGEAAVLYWQTYRDEIGEPEWAADLEAHAARHTLGCLLARVAGRSRLEYLSAVERERQRDVVLRMMRDTPPSMDALVCTFVRSL